jgi:hypothetical protein
MSAALTLMNAAALVGVALFARSHALFAVAWLIAMAAAAGLDRPALAGIVLLGPGLFGIRVVLLRSVSVSMLSGAPAPSARIERRVDELERLGLARQTENGLELTAFGRAVSALMHALYRLLGHLR